MTEPLRILQLGELLASDGEAGRKSQLSGILDALAHRFAESGIDYIVVCGNVTADATESSFDLAAQGLQKLAETVLGHKHRQDELAGRLIIAPGFGDLIRGATGDPMANFNAFLSRLKRKLRGPSEEPDLRLLPNRPQVYELRDGTFIVAPYLHEPEGLAIDEVLDSASLALSDMTYSQHTPTLLVSAANPGSSWDRQFHFVQNIHDIAQGRLQINFHLSGPSPTFIMQFESYVYRHIGLGQNSGASRGIWHFRANVLEIVFSPAEQSAWRRAFTVERHVLEQGAWNVLSWPGHDTLFLDEHRAAQYNLLDVHQPLREGLLNWLHNSEKKPRRLTYIPGSGIDKCFEELKELSGSERPDLPWIIIFKPIDTPDPTRLTTNRKEVLENLFDKLMDEVFRQRRSSNVRMLLVLHDLSYNTWESGEDRIWLDHLWTRLSSDFEDESFRVLYLVTPKASEREFADDRFPELTIGPVNRESVIRLMEPYSRQFPFEPQVVESLTGGALQLERLILEQGRQEFASRWTVHEPVTSANACSLVKRACQASEPAAAFSNTLSAINRMTKGPEFLARIRKSIENRPDVCQKNLAVPLPHVTDFSLISSFLFRQGLLGSSGDDYTIRALGPFLYGTLAQTVNEPIRSPAPSRLPDRPEADVVICYAYEDRELVDKFRKVLRPVAAQMQFKVWHDSILSEQGKRWDQNLDRVLKTVPIGIFFVSKNSIDTGKYMVEVEVKAFLDREAANEQVYYMGVLCDECAWHILPCFKNFPMVIGRTDTKVRYRDEEGMDQAWAKLIPIIMKNVAEMRGQSNGHS